MFFTATHDITFWILPVFCKKARHVRPLTFPYPNLVIPHLNKNVQLFWSDILWNARSANFRWSCKTTVS